MTTADFHSLLTLIGIIAFIAMVIWVFGKKQRTQMDRNALIAYLQSLGLALKDRRS